MESKVRLSKYSLGITIIVLGSLLAGILLVEDNKSWYFLFIVTFLLLLFSFRYSPVKIKADEDNVTVKCITRRHNIKIDEIESVEMFQPTMTSFRLCGSGGFFGYWGIFKEGDIGRYAAYYGKVSDCFLIRMKNGNKYVLGCENPIEMVNFINSKIRPQ